MNRKVAVIGAGPSGLAAAKSAIELGLEPTIFEARSDIGGLWQQPGGHVWPDMRTNLSKWTCAFSDFPWSDDADEFPASTAVHGYLKDYASHFGLAGRIEFATRVTGVRASGESWAVATSTSATPRGPFAGLMIAAGAFACTSVPSHAQVSRFRGELLHSGDYKGRTDVAGKRVVVVGGSVSGIEISAHLARHGAEVTTVLRRPIWIMPRYLPAGSKAGRAPADLVLYRRGVEGADVDGSGEHHRRTATLFEKLFGNPGDAHEALRTSVDESPPYLAVSDDFLDQVRCGAVSPVRGSMASTTETGIVMSDGRHLPADILVLCTGYQIDLGFLPEQVRAVLSYDPAQSAVPFIAHQAMFHPQVPNICFVGMYRGPYFGVMELQARWAVSLLCGARSMPGRDAIQHGLDLERDLRDRRPRPQYPHGDYVRFADSIATELGVHPRDVSSPRMRKATRDGPVVPAHYRLVGAGAKPHVAEQTILSACARVGITP